MARRPRHLQCEVVKMKVKMKNKARGPYPAYICVLCKKRLLFVYTFEEMTDVHLLFEKMTSFFLF